MKTSILVNRRGDRRTALLAAAAAALVPVTGALAGTTPGAVTVSTAGSTALKNWFVKSTTTFTDVTPGTQVDIGGVEYPSSLNEWAPQFGGTGTALAFQLAPKSYNNGVPVNSTTNPGTLTDQASAVRFEYHESGSVEGILEMANDQIGPVSYVTQNVDRNPQSGIGNAVWVNYTAIGGSTTAIPFSVATGAQTNASNLQNSYYLGNFYSGTNTFTNYSTVGGAQPSFNLAGGNLNGGQNAVQLAVSDAIPLQVFAQPSTGTDSNASTPWARTPADANYGTGNPLLPTGSLGTANSRQVYQSTTALNMPATAINPRTGTAFGTGGWNTGGLNNLNSQTVAITATLFVANPGTGLTQVDQTDAQWLETQSRLQNGAVFNMTTRDVNSGTRNVSALETGIDPTWATGKNDDGNGNAADGAGPSVTGQVDSQINIGDKLRFSNKTAGGNELRPTVEVNRMAVGTLAINDNSSVSTNGKADPLRTLLYSPSPTGAPLANGSSSYVLANYYTITGTPDPVANPNGQQYQIFQNEQFVTLKAPDSSYGSASPNIQGDDATGDVKSLINNSLSSVVAFNSSASNPASPAAGLETQGYILPQQMTVRKAENGLNTPGSVSAIVPNTVANGATAAQAYNASSAASPTGLTASEISTLNMGTPSSITTGTGSYYGGSSAGASAPGFVSQIPITSVNYLFGNFNQNGVRDYDSVVVEAQIAQAALYASGAGTSALSGASNQTHITTGVSALDTLVNPEPDTNGNTVGITKGDLIALGDYDGRGVFDGMSLYEMATGASLATSGAGYQPTEVHTATGTVFTTGHLNATAATFSTAIDGGTLFKNTALDYLQANATPQQKIDAAAVLELPVGVTAIPIGATQVGTDAVSGQVQYTFDRTGINAFNKTDVNRDGVVDFNDAVLIDNNNGMDYTSLANSLTATEQAPLTGAIIPANLVLISQTDTGTKIGANDLAVANTALTGTGATNWYGYALNKTGPGTITFGRTGGTVTVFSSAAAFNISSGTVQIGARMDPFTDSSVTSNTDTTKSIGVTTNGGTLEYLAGSSTINLQRIGTLNVSTGGLVKLDSASAHTARTALEVGTLNLSGGLVDLGNGDLIVQNVPGGSALATITSATASGYNLTGGGNYAGTTGVTSSAAAADTSHLMALGVVQNNQSGTPLFHAAAGTTPASLFDGIAPNPTDVLVKYTYVGDANLDGKIDGSDYSLIDAGYASGGTLTGWYNGDFNYDGVIDGSDYALLDNAYNNQGGQLSTPTALLATATDQVAGPGVAAVPEPTSLGLAALAAASLGARRRRVRQA